MVAQSVVGQKRKPTKELAEEHRNKMRPRVDALNEAWGALPFLSFFQ
jgi:hypothetical protein